MRFSLFQTGLAKIRIRVWPALLLLTLTAAIILILCLFMVYPHKINGIGVFLLKGEIRQIVSPINATVESWLVEEGQSIKNGQVLVMLRLFGDSDDLRPVIAKAKGVIAEITAYPNTTVKQGQTLAIITNVGDPRRDLEIKGFVSSLDGKKIIPGMKAYIEPSISDPFIHGRMVGTVKNVGKLPMSKAALQSVIKIPELAKYIRKNIDAEPFVVVLSLIPDESHKTGYLWTGPGIDNVLDSGILAKLTIVYGEASLLSLLWPTVFPNTGMGNIK